MEPGAQIIYVPSHAHGDTSHPDCEEGFVTSERNGTVFCRYWSKRSPGELRTKANSEGCDRTMLILKDTRRPEVVAAELAKLT